MPEIKRSYTHATDHNQQRLDNSNAGQKPAKGWFLSKWVYNFWPARSGEGPGKKKFDQKF